MMTRTPAIALLLGLSMLAGAVPAVGQATDTPEDDTAFVERRELGDAMRRLFRNRMRAELGLTDAQMQAIMPVVEQIEEARAWQRRQRARLARELQQGLRGGATDAELQAALDELQRSEVETAAREREMLGTIHAELTVRQRVQFLFFIERFRRQLQDRVRTLRDDRRGGSGGRRPGR